MKTVLERNESTLVRDRSEFIGILIHVTSTESVNQYLKDIRNEYPKAKHYCYAYIIQGRKKCSDDGEPSKTAGRPLLELLKKKNMDEILLVVVRYFGGVLLGASRLMSTYLETGVQVIDSADILEIENKFVYNAHFSYRDFDVLKRLSKTEDFSLENIQYEDDIIVDIVGEETIGTKLSEYFPSTSVEVIGTKKVYRRH